MDSDSLEIIRIVPAGDEALVVEFAPVISRAVNRCVRTLFQAVTRTSLAEIKGIVPSYRSVLIYYDPNATSFESLRDRIRDIGRQAANVTSQTRKWTLPICYGLDCSDDLNDLADRLKMPVDAIVGIHSYAPYMVYMIGFSPGFAYLGELPPELEIPRKAVPAPRVAANAIQVGGRQTAVSSMPMPSGWYVVGRTPVPMFDPAREKPFLLDGGDLVALEPINEASFERLSEEVARNAFFPRWEFID